MRFSPDGDASRGRNGCRGMDIRCAECGEETALFTEHTGQVNARHAFSQDGKNLRKRRVCQPCLSKFGDVENEKQNFQPFRLTPGPVFSLPALTFYGRTLIKYTDRNREVNLLACRHRPQKLSESRLENPINTVIFSQDGSTLAIGDRNGRITVMRDTTTSRQQAES